jgi:hypothetical protein
MGRWINRRFSHAPSSRSTEAWSGRRFPVLQGGRAPGMCYLYVNLPRPVQSSKARLPASGSLAQARRQQTALGPWPQHENATLNHQIRSLALSIDLVRSMDRGALGRIRTCYMTRL